MMNDDLIKEILKDSKVIAVVGASNTESKASNSVPKYLIGVGYTVIPVNPFRETVFDLKSKLI